jgi:hypothetical protein
MLNLCVALALMVLAGSATIAAVAGDPHIVQRGGALLAAISAMLAIIEAFVEQKVRATGSEIEREVVKGSGHTAISRLEYRIRNARFRADAEQLSSEKIRAVFLISSIAILGEVLHGFGDWVFEPALALFH